MKRTLIGAAVAAAAILAATAGAQGPGMMGGYGPGYGMGPGMMGGYGPGYGMGPGMMGGYWRGYGALNLTEEQRDKIDSIQEDLSRKQWELMGRMHSQSYRFGDSDDAAARKAYQEMAAAHKEMFETMLDARKRIDSVLTPEQRKELRR